MTLDQSLRSRWCCYHAHPDNVAQTSSRSCCAVRSCSPPVPGLDALLAALNEDRSFSSFVRAMRREFQAVT